MDTILMLKVAAQYLNIFLDRNSFFLGVANIELPLQILVILLSLESSQLPEKKLCMDIFPC